MELHGTSLWYRVFMGSDALLGGRWQLPHTPPPPTESPWSFVRSQCTKTLRYIFIIDAAQCYTHLNSLFLRSLSGNGALPITAQGYIFSCTNIIWVEFIAQFSCNILYLAYFVWRSASVKPRTFGRWRDALRRFLGWVSSARCIMHLMCSLPRL